MKNMTIALAVLAVALTLMTGCASMRRTEEVAIPKNGDVCLTQDKHPGYYCNGYCSDDGCGSPRLAGQRPEPVVTQEVEYDACADIRNWLTDPMSLAGKKCVMRFQVLQVVDDRTVLLEIEGDYQMGREAIFYGQLIPAIKLLNVVDGQRIAALVEIKGTKTYVTPMGATKTVPSMDIRHITVFRS